MLFKSFICLCFIYGSVLCTLDQKRFQHEALMAHNLYRLIHGVPKLSINKNLSKIAFTRAQELVQSRNLFVKQLDFEGGKLGETIGCVSGFSSYNGISATQLWYSMVSKFDQEGEDSLEAASFSQVIWKSTKEVGFGVAENDGKFYFVAEYFPSGNIPGQYDTNVFQLNIADDLISKLNKSELENKIDVKLNENNFDKFLTGILEIIYNNNIYNNKESRIKIESSDQIDN
ncbi:Golgi-associated plant pathogenesis-related 1 [Brachionus plicatilis]|uniref:Golgi-associated plant pathogenesis-related 1 n=1 Tax=Brachionus plicatilis TaxID=10195 RepID=A0A3M7PSM0_BRAPC|nr:Golgi-associated plant pathogenesis-related 1 [Brachionus plicatilis]